MPAEIIGRVFCGDTMEAAEPFLDATVVGIDIVDVKIRGVRIWIAGLRQDVGRNPCFLVSRNNKKYWV
jgi:hypothetical protein